MSSTPFMQLYVGDYIGKTLDLTTEQHGAYLLILMAMWQHDAKLPADAQKLARIARLTPVKFRAVWAGISRFFDEQDGCITNRRLTKERKKAAEKSAKRALAGSAGGKAKALKDNEARLANAMPLPQHSPDTRYQKEEDTNVSLSAEPTLRDLAHVDAVAEAVADYNRTAAEAGWPVLRILSKSRRAALVARMREAGGIHGWRDALAKARSSPHLCGQNDRGWTASFDFLTKQSSFAKLMEGNYDDRQSARKNQYSRADASNLAIACAGATRKSPDPDWI